jgi:hypothetical protein
VSEDAFGFLEPSVKQHCPRYRDMSHWGMTDVRREEWVAILRDWEWISKELEQPRHLNNMCGQCGDEAQSRFTTEFVDAKPRVIGFISELHAATRSRSERDRAALKAACTATASRFN